MPTRQNELHVISFDPGGVIGWSHFVVNTQAFAHPREYVLKNLLEWRTGEFDGTEHENIASCLDLIRNSRYSGGRLMARYEIITEDFELTQLLGGDDLLSPVRINAVLEYELNKLQRLNLNYQKRSMRTGVTRERCKMWGCWPLKGKDSFAATQHGLTYLKRLKVRADEITWERLLQRAATGLLLSKNP